MPSVARPGTFRTQPWPLPRARACGDLALRQKDEDEEDDNDNEEATSKQRPTSSDVWDFVDKTMRKCPNCSKTFGKKTGISSICAYLKSYRLFLLKKSRQL